MCDIIHKLFYERTEDASVLSDFFCGIDEMDSFIHNSLQNRLKRNDGLYLYIVREGANIVALIALKESSIEIRLDKERMFSVVSLEIEYLAVERAQQRKHIGKQILAWVENEIVPTYANSKYITVRAFQNRDIDYSAVPFYESCGFRVIQKPHPMANNVKMAKKIEK